ncbi:MAG TPA: zf-HC2 domain-containing protein [Gemmatimonadaceae bacterium]|nr:zf-HC2 domain-containing protein [Gemmatimonadaceae bacterium]
MTNREQQHMDLDRLGDLLDGRLAIAERRVVELHLATCDACMARRDHLEALVGAAHALPDEIEPPPRLWDDARDRISPRQITLRARHWSLLAAAALILIALSSIVTVFLTPRPTVVVLEPRTSPATNASFTPPPVARSIDADYAGAIHELSETLAERRAQLDPATIAKVEASLRVIDVAIDEARRALAADPADPTLPDLLAGHYERKVELLRRANALLPST